MSLMKNNSKTGCQVPRKGFNLTAQVNEAILSYNNNKAVWKCRTSKLIKTLTNQGINSNSNVMTEDDIDRLFGRERIGEKGAALNKVSTEVTETWGAPVYRNFTNLVKFLQIKDSYDKFLTGIPDEFGDEERIDQLFVKDHGEKDLTLQFKKNYLVGKIIGEGAYASVRVAIFKPQQKKIAIKVYEKSKIEDPQRKKSVRREIRILQLLKHPNIVKIIDVVETNNHLNIVMEYLPGVSLGSYLKVQPNGKICEKNCKKIFKSLTKALAYMHSLNIAHRDVKLENIILDQQINPKIIDFGFSTCIEPGKKIKIFCGTPSYMAPQVVQRKQYRGEGADIWALGVMLFVCLTGMFPFKGSTDQELYKKINNSDYPKGELIFSRIVSDLIFRMLKIDPEERITANQVHYGLYQILKHQWFMENRSESSKKKLTQTSLQQNRKRINTLNSHMSKDIKQALKTGTMKNALIETVGCENLQLELKNALRLSNVKKQINSYRKNDKQNAIKYLKSEKNTFRAKQTNEKIERTDKSEASDKKNKLSKTHSKVMDILKMQMRKRESEKPKSKNRF